jgi:hypothetical protein
VKEGYLGDLTLSIPWSNLKGKPVRVLVENVYLLAAPKNSSAQVDEDEEEERAQAAKQEKLANAELLGRDGPHELAMSSGGWRSVRFCISHSPFADLFFLPQRMRKRARALQAPW